MNLVSKVLVFWFLSATLFYMDEDRVVCGQGTELVPISVPDYKKYDWEALKLSFWGARLEFPGMPAYSEKEIYTEKGLVNQKKYYWASSDESISLEAVFYPLPEELNVKNEKKLMETVSNRIALSYNGYPSLSAGQINSSGITEYNLEIKTVKSAVYSSKIYASGEQVLIIGALINKPGEEAGSIAHYFLETIQFNPLKGEVKSLESGMDAVQTHYTEKWDTLSFDKFYLTFPKYPIGQHKLLQKGNLNQRYYEWYMSDEQNQSTYIFALIPLENLSDKDVSELISSGIEYSLRVTDGKLVQQRSLDYFANPVEEALFKTGYQYFRTRYFYDENYIYQLLVSGPKVNIYQKDANRFMDGLRWIE